MFASHASCSSARKELGAVEVVVIGFCVGIGESGSADVVVVGAVVAVAGGTGRGCGAACTGIGCGDDCTGIGRALGFCPASALCCRAFASATHSRSWFA